MTAVVDGSVQSGLTVTDGAVTLTTAGQIVSVGLPVDNELEPMDVQVPVREGSGMGRQRTIASVSLYLENTRQLYVLPAEATDEDSATSQIKFPASQTFGDPPLLFTGLKRDEAIPFSDSDAPRVVFTVPDPVPCTINAVVFNAQAGQI